MTTVLDNKYCQMGQTEISIYAWAMRKSDLFSLVQRRFHEFFENVWQFINGIASNNSYRNSISCQKTAIFDEVGNLNIYFK